ncbi:MAG: alpha-mannosidase [Firmicutes bacterium]|nr:alpha-mannosidase [Bacillota bacterium]
MEHLTGSMPEVGVPKTKQELHMIGNAHLDPVWLWQWPEGLGALRATFRSALDRLEETEGFIFTSSQAAMYEYTERCDPKLFAEIKLRVDEGRWVIAGGWWVQADCNVPGSEGMVRQALYGLRYFKEKFGIKVPVGYNVDSFGHSASLPQILKGSGQDYYVFMRPGPHEKPELPGRIFQWEGPDGSRVLAYQIPYSYQAAGYGDELVKKINDSVKELDQRQPLLMCFYGVGNHGGGPTKENLNSIQTAARESDIDILFSDPNRFFTQLEKENIDFPVVKDDLQHHASGCYAAHSRIKQNNRKAEHGLCRAEKISSVANNLVGYPYPQKQLNRAWKRVLFNHFHDILPGTSIREAYVDANHMHGFALHTADETANLALQALAAEIDTSHKGTPIIVWNPHAHRQQAAVRLELMWEPGEMALTDHRGNEISLQNIEISSVIWSGWRRGLTFVADVPALGYAVYWLHPRKSTAKSAQGVKVGETVLENAHLKLELERRTGYIKQMTAKPSCREIFSGPAGVPVVMDDPSDTWSHGVFHFHDEIGRFTDAQLEVVETGPVRGIIRATSHFERSRIVQEFTLYVDLPYVDVKTIVDWREKQKALKLEFPVNVRQPKATYEIQFGAITRPTDGKEEPSLNWFDVSGQIPGESGQQGLAILNDAKYSSDVADSVMRLTVLRSPVYAHHLPREVEPKGFYHYTDQGVQEFTYRLVPHKGEWQTANAPRLALELNAPMLVLEEHNHPGRLPTCYTGLDVSSENIVVSAVKESEDEDGFIVRAYEANGHSTRCTFSWDQGAYTWDSSFEPFEIKSFLVNSSLGEGPIEVDLIERMTSKGRRDGND